MVYISEKGPRRPPKPTLFCVGKTEQYYFRHLRKVRGYHMDIVPRLFRRMPVDEMERRVQTLLEDGGQAVCVFDTETSQWTTEERRFLHAFCKHYARQKNVIICTSRPSIDYWFYLHFYDETPPFTTSREVIDELANLQQLQGYKATDNYLEDEGWVRNLCADGRLEAAWRRAAFRRMPRGLPYSNVYRIIEVLEKHRLIYYDRE
ncbi:MAG: RloB domain-containing protein [Prevotella sp.]|nr:RloB domain-containing protein [Prevotella sp.]